MKEIRKTMKVVKGGFVVSLEIPSDELSYWDLDRALKSVMLDFFPDSLPKPVMSKDLATMNFD